MKISGFIKKYPLLAYFILTFALSWGALLILIGVNGMPTAREELNAQLPVAILAMLGGPSVAGLLMTGLVHGRAGFRELFSRLFKWRVGFGWYALALLTGPLVLLAALFLLSLVSPVYLPGILTADNKLSLLLPGIVGGVLVGICEELGWTGFAVPILRSRYSIVTTGLMVGIIWGAWHILSNDIWAIGTYSGALSPALYLVLNGFGFLIGQLPAFRLLMVWVYDRTGSLLVVTLMHASLTAATLVLSPLAISGAQVLIYGYLVAVVMWIVAAAFTLANREQF